MSNENYHGWQKTVNKEIMNFNREVILSGSSQIIELPFDNAINLKRIELCFDGTNARDIGIKMYSNINTSVYTQFDNVSANTSRSRYLDFDTGYAYLTPIKLSIEFDNSTASDIVDIQVVAEAL